MANILWLALGIVEFPEVTLREGVLNKRQCEHLFANFQKGVEILQTITNGRAEVFHEAQRELFGIVNQGRLLIEECCNGKWVHVVVMQLNNKEWFRELLLDFEYCFHTLCDISCHYNPHEKERILVSKNGTTFYPSCMSDVKEDQTLICTRLSRHLNSCNIKDCNDCKLGRYLWEYMMSLQHVQGGELDKIVFPCEYPQTDCGDGSKPIVRNVYKTTWMGFECAMKVMCISREDENRFWKEASILGGLNHPNIIKFFCFGYNEAMKRFELVMEFGERSLSEYLGECCCPLEEMNAVDIMLQIAKGMCYLHDMKVAHCDLKPQNVVVIQSKDVKLLDFGISKVEVKEYPEPPTGRCNMGTPGYMAPEAMAKELSGVDALKADVFSFGMMCSDILSGEKPCLNRFALYIAYIEESKRPKLPVTYSEALRSLVEECWAFHASERPTFLDIRRRLVTLKNKMLKGSFENAKCTNDTIGCTPCKSFLECTQQLRIIPEVDHFYNSSLTSNATWNYNEWSPHSLSIEVNANNMMECSKLIGVQDKMYLLEEQLQRVGSLGFVGMGGIGKSTLAMALSDHISHQFDTICFVTDLKDETSTFTLKHKSMGMQDSPPREETLRKIRDILGDVQKVKKVLLVVDNVQRESQLCQLLGDGMFMNLIASSRDWNSLKGHVPIDGKVDMQTLKGNEPMRLFSMNAFGANKSCLPYLKDVVAKIVDACCGLPLSLEVMGTCMQGETRLRIWERTLERLLRARYDGDANEKICKVLRISFDVLTKEEKNMFLDIACFFCNNVFTTRDTFLRMLEGNARETLDSLHNKSLVKVGEWDRFDMHDQLRDLGRMITETEEEYAGTRLYDLNYFAFANHWKQKGTKLVQGLSFTRLEHDSNHEVDFDLNPMRKLHILNVECCDNIEALVAIVERSPHLKCLSVEFSSQNTSFSTHEINLIGNFWDHFQDYVKQLCVLEVSDCNFSGSLSYEYSTMLPLKAIHIWGCQNIDKFLNKFVKISTLESLIVGKCPDLRDISLRFNNRYGLNTLHFLGRKYLKKIPGGFGGLTSLKTFTVWECETLEKFPRGLSKLSALEELTLSNCLKLKVIPEGFGGLKKLKKLDMQGCEALEEFPVGLSNLSALEELDFSICRKLKVIPEGFGGLTKLKKLDMWECEALEEFPVGLSNLSALEELNFLKCLKLKVIPEGFGGLKKLKKVHMQGCEALEEFPVGLSNLSALEELDFSICRKLKVIPEGFGGLTKLKKLHMWECEALEEFPVGLSNLSALEELNFLKCLKLKVIPEGFGGLKKLKKVHMQGCEALEEFPVGLSNLSALEELDFSICRKLKVIPEGFGGLTKLKKLDMWECEALEEFPVGLSNLSALEELNLLNCLKLKVIPEGFGGLKKLKKVHMQGCEALEEFPVGLSNLSALEELDFSICRKLKVIPEGFGGLTKLKKLDMWECEALEEFPVGLSNLSALEELNFSGCRNLKVIPEGFGGLTKLKNLHMQGCEALEEFPVGLSNLSALEKLNFSICWKLKVIPEGFGGLTRLKKLDMWECEALEEFPVGLSNLSALEELNLLNCLKLKVIPEGFGGLKKLKKVHMQGCEALEEFPVGLSNLSALEELDFSKCRKLKVIPEGFGGLTKLKKLEMWECEALEEFPVGLSNLSGLEELDFSKCRKMKEILEGFGGLTKLKKVHMQGCEALQEFPVGLSNLLALEELDYSGCRNLKVIPKGFGGLTKLKNLTCGNPRHWRNFM